MSAPDDESDELTTAYRRASDADAARPSAATRAAILAEARAAAARRAPAANDSRFSWRVAAGLAVMGVAVLLWRQLPRDAAAPLEGMPRPTVVAEAVDRGTIAPAADATVERESAPAAATAPPPPPREAPSAEAKRADSPPPPTPPVVVDLNVRQPVPEAPTQEARPVGSAALAQSRAAERSAAAPSPRNALEEVVTVGPRRADVPGLESLVRREFPTLLSDATPPPGVWIVQDARGRTLRTGTLVRDESMGDVMARLQRETPDRPLRPFQIAPLRTTQGATVLVGVSRAE